MDGNLRPEPVPVVEQIAGVMGFVYDRKIPVNCLAPTCWMERFIGAVEEELAEGAYC